MDLDNGNGILIPENKNHKFWFKHIKMLIENPSMIKSLGENLYDTVNGKYDMKSVCTQRAKLYKQIIIKKEEEVFDVVN